MSHRQTIKPQSHEPRNNSVHRRTGRGPSAELQSINNSLGNHAVQRLIQSPYIQTKLQVSTPNDPLEQEADKTADRVMRMADEEVTSNNEAATNLSSVPADQTTVATKSKSKSHTVPIAVREDDKESDDQGHKQVQRACSHCEEDEPVQRKCAECDEEQKVNRKEADATTTASVAGSIEGMKGGGSPLPTASRAFFEPRFGTDLSNVRVHTDSRAESSARSLNARAFTVGRDIAFGAGQYSPESNDGRRLLAHELTHTVQQGATSRSTGVVARNVIQRDRDKSDKKNRKELTLEQFYPDNQAIIASLSFDQLRIWHDVIEGWNANRKVDDALARHEQRARAAAWDPGSGGYKFTTDYIDKQERIEQGRQFVDEARSQVALDPNQILSPEITAPQPWNVAAEDRFRTWAVQYFASQSLIAELSSKRELVSQLEETQHPGLSSGIPHVNLKWGGGRIRHTRGIVTWNDLMDLPTFRDKYSTDVINSPEKQAIHKGIKELHSHIDRMKFEHQAISDANAEHGIVRHVSEALGAPDILELTMARLKVAQNPSDVDAKAELAEKEAEAGNYPKLRDDPVGTGTWHDAEAQLKATEQFMQEGKFELALAALTACEHSTAIATTKFAGYQRRVMRGAGTAVEWLQRAKTAGKIASAFTGTGGVIRAAITSAGYSFAQEGSQQVVAHWINPSNKIDLSGLVEQAAIEGLVSMFGGVTQGAFVNALTARFGARLVNAGLSEGASRTLISAVGATTSSFYNAPAEIVLQKIIAGKEVPKSLSEVAQQVTDQAWQSFVMDAGGNIIHYAQTKAPTETKSTEQVKEIEAPRAVVESLAGNEGATFAKDMKPGAQESGTTAEPAKQGTEQKEITSAEAIKYVNEHQEMILDRNKPGKRHAPAGEGHEVKERPTPEGIVCELHSTGPIPVPCPRGMGEGEPATVALPKEMELLVARKLPDDIQQNLFGTLDRVRVNGDYVPDQLARMITVLRHVPPKELSHDMSTMVQINRTSSGRTYHDESSIWWGRLKKVETVSLLEAKLRGYNPTTGRERRLNSGAKGETLGESVTPDGDHTKIDTLVGDSMDRKGLEEILPTRSEVTNTETHQALDIMVGERLHAIGAGLGAESGKGIAHGSSFINQFLQRQGVEQMIRFLHRNRPDGVRYVVHVEVHTRVAPGGETRILESITYKVRAVEEVPGGFKPLRDMFEGTITQPKQTVRATKPRGKGDIQAVGADVEPNFGALAEHFGL